jgi:hypothetical protein
MGGTRMPAQAAGGREDGDKRQPGAQDCSEENATG